MINFDFFIKDEVKAQKEYMKLSQQLRPEDRLIVEDIALQEGTHENILRMLKDKYIREQQ